MRKLKKIFFSKNKVVEKDLFFGLHIHKTAGMTLFEQINSQLERDQFYINSMHAVNFKKNVKELEERLPEELKNIRIVFGHGIHQYMLTYFKDRNVKLFTFLREPISRIVSWYCYDRKLLKRFGHEIPSFEEFYNRYFPHCSLCAMITRAFPVFIDSQDDPVYLQAISVLKKFYFIATIDDFSTKTPLLLKEVGITFSAETRKNITDYTRELDFEDQIDVDFLREHNQDDMKLYEAVQKVKESGELNYFGLDESGYQQSINTMFSRNVNPHVMLLRSYRGPIKHNYKLEKIYDEALAKYEKELSYLLASRNGQDRELSNVLIKLYGLEENESKKKYYKEHLSELNIKFNLGLSQMLV